jgi:hypothetical protein
MATANTNTSNTTPNPTPVTPAANSVSKPTPVTPPKSGSKLGKIVKHTGREILNAAFPGVGRFVTRYQKAMKEDSSNQIRMSAGPTSSNRPTLKVNANSHKEVGLHLNALHQHIVHTNGEPHNVTIEHPNGNVHNVQVSKHGGISGYVPEDGEGVPANNIGGGYIEGAGVGPRGEPGVDMKNKKKVIPFKLFTRGNNGKNSKT